MMIFQLIDLITKTIIQRWNNQQNIDLNILIEGYNSKIRQLTTLISHNDTTTH